MNIHTGTSGFSYKEWKGSFYPADLPASAMLRYYAEQFTTVELNNTFYRMPKESVLSGWAEDVPAHFTFAIKANRQITHLKRLRDVAEPVAFLFAATAVLGERRGPILFGLPPNMKKDMDRLRALLSLLPAAARAAIEFRHESWLDDEVCDALRAHDVALCIADAEDASTPLVPTAGWGYVRLRRTDYDDAALARWRQAIEAQTWTDAWVYFKHEDEGTGPKLGRTFERLGARPA